jgi:hypothetical protein
MTQRAALEIVWRNPKPPQRRQRWQQIEQDSGTPHYLVRNWFRPPRDRSGRLHLAWK